MREQQLSGLRVLVVDDLSSARKIVVKCLKELGFEDVLTASNGREALS
ncbi:MAG: response regulator, partial [Candidatus Dadabacteria bacterium]